MRNHQKRFKNLHLSVSALLIFGIAVIYGFLPEKIIPALADLKTGNNDFNNAFKAIMGLYFGLGLFWLSGVVTPSLWKGATLVNIFTMLGLAFGRIISFILDGLPAEGMIGGTFLEIFLGSWGIISYQRFKI